DIKKILSKAVSQMPDDREGIIHVCYETVNGPEVEIKRHEKISETVKNFNYWPKKIDSVYCHALQPLTMVDNWEWAETTLFFENTPNVNLSEMLLLDPQGTPVRDATHWAEDLIVKRQNEV